MRCQDPGVGDSPRTAASAAGIRKRVAASISSRPARASGAAGGNETLRGVPSMYVVAGVTGHTGGAVAEARVGPGGRGRGIVRAAAQTITDLRPVYFSDNFAAVLPATQGGVLPTFLTPDRRIPMVATADIGRVAAELLFEPAAGTRVVELSAIRDWSPNDVAEELSIILGRAISVQPGPLEGVVPAFTGMGMPRGVAELFREMFAALNNGTIRRQGRPALRRMV